MSHEVNDNLRLKKKDRNYTEKELLFLDALFGPEAKGNVRKAMYIAGYSENTSSLTVIRALKQEIIEAAQEVLASGTPLAVMGLFEAITDPNKLGTSNVIKAAQQILDRAGLVKPEQDLNLKVPEGGLVILPAKKTREIINLDDDKPRESNTSTVGEEEKVS